MGIESSLLSNELFLRLAQLLTVFSVIGALIAAGYILFEMKAEPGKEDLDPNWRALFLFWWDSVAIIVLYAAVNFVWVAERFIGILTGALFGDGAKLFNLQYVLMVLEFMIYGMILIIAIRLSRRIRRHLSASS